MRGNLLKAASGWMAAVVAAALIALAIVSGDMPARSSGASAAVAPAAVQDRATTGSHIVLASLETDAAAPDAAPQPVTTVTKTPVRSSSFFDRFNSSFGDELFHSPHQVKISGLDLHAMQDIHQCPCLLYTSPSPRDS